MGNLPGRKWVLKKWTVKMNPEASSASSLWTMIATLKTQPGRNLPKNSGNQSIRPDPPMANMPQNTARKSNFSQ